VQIPVITLTRKQLYDEVWEISVAGVSRKYDIPYAQLIKQLKAASIPIPPSGYWTKLRLGKAIEKTDFSGLPEASVALYRELTVAREPKLNNQLDEKTKCPDETQGVMSDSLKEELVQQSEENLEQSIKEKPAILNEIPETTQRYGQIYNIYDRETLYREVWAAPVTEIAKKYKVSDVAIHKVCKSLDVPTPPLGYWAKLRAGKSVTRTPLPQSTKEPKKTGIQTGYTTSADEDTQRSLDFLGEEDKSVVLAIASQIRLPDENERMHSAIIAHRKVIAEWKKNESNKDNNRWQQRKTSPPYLAGTIANDSIPRACHIIDALIKAMEPLDCKLTEQLEFVVNGEMVAISFSESQDKVPHVPTKEENRRLLEYEERRKKYSFEAKPQIRKYDYLYNGRLSLTVAGQKSFRDCKAYRLEDRLGDVLLEMYIASERLKQQRLAREEAERKRQEEAERKEAHRKIYNEEVDRTTALENEAEDYSIACKIRAYIDAYAAKHENEDISEWVAWANAKANWYDPTISRKDELLGERSHGKDSESKKPKYVGYWR